METGRRHRCVNERMTVLLVIMIMMVMAIIMIVID